MLTFARTLVLSHFAVNFEYAVNMIMLACTHVVPHPYEPKMNLRLQTKGVPAMQVLIQGLNSMADMCDELEDKYTAAAQTHEG